MPLAPGDKAPEMWGDDPWGDPQLVDYSAAKVTLINFWATWCVPCQEELPMLQRMHESYGDGRLQIVAITNENTENQAIADFLAQYGVTFPVFRPSPKVKPKWVGVEGTLPNSYLIDSSGKVMRRYVGATPEQIEGMENDLLAAIEGRQLGTMVMPSKPAVATSADRPKPPKN